MSSCGIDSLPTLVTTRRTKWGLAFNLLVVGSTGIGKTTLINSLFDFDYGDTSDYERILENVELSIKEYRPQNKSQDMKLTIIETKGFNNQLDRSDIHTPLVDYIEARFEDYRREELQAQETRYNHIADNRVHLCIYIIPPTARGLKPIDLVTMKKLHQRVCLIPVIGRSDQLTKQERQAIKKVIMKEISEHKIETYSPREHGSPFAVAASDDIVNENGKRRRVRSFPWGQMFIERDSDFLLLKDCLLRSDMLALIDTTNKVHYEKYRVEATRRSEEFYNSNIHFNEKKSILLRELEKYDKIVNCS